MAGEQPTFPPDDDIFDQAFVLYGTDRIQGVTDAALDSIYSNAYQERIDSTSEAFYTDLVLGSLYPVVYGDQALGTISVEEGEELMYDINKDGVVDAADLALFCSDWIYSSTDGRCNFDLEGEVDKQDLMLFSRWWMYDNR
jgi:hypothetical protein